MFKPCSEQDSRACYMKPRTRRHFGGSPVCLQTEKTEAGGSSVSLLWLSFQQSGFQDEVEAGEGG